MVVKKPSVDNNSLVKATLDWIANVGIDGMGALRPAESIAADYLDKSASVEDAINSLIAWRTAHAAGTGFIILVLAVLLRFL